MVAKDDARNRILSCKGRVGLARSAQGWKVSGKNESGKWVVASEDLNRQQIAFANFMARVAGKFTRAYLEEMPYRVEDRWLMSLFLHLMLDSISIWQKEESEAREFPFL